MVDPTNIIDERIFDDLSFDENDYKIDTFAVDNNIYPDKGIWDTYT